ncbi:MAG: hypothetical protein WAW63_00200 [Candidatus Saccharimonadales bacterium]|jgi:hypothetical protein|nr:hypothetical protein [Candidatus Saccharibacteria bacterium]
MGRLLTGGVAIATAFTVYALYDYHSGGSGAPANTYRRASDALPFLADSSGGNSAAQTALVGAAEGENILPHRNLVSSDVAAIALRQLKQSGANGCPSSAQMQIYLNPNRTTSAICLDVNGAYQAPSSEITFRPYMRQEVVSLEKTLSDPNNTAVCRELFQQLGNLAQSLFHTPAMNAVVPPGNDVAVAIQLGKNPFSKCDLHTIAQGGKL